MKILIFKAFYAYLTDEHVGLSYPKAINKQSPRKECYVQAKNKLFHELAIVFVIFVSDFPPSE